MRIFIGSAVIAIVSCPLPLSIVIPYRVGVPRVLPVLSPSIGTTMQVYMRVGCRGQGWIFRVFRLQFICQGLKLLTFFWVFVIYPHIRVVLRHHRLSLRWYQVYWLYK